MSSSSKRSRSRSRSKGRSGSRSISTSSVKSEVTSSRGPVGSAQRKLAAGNLSCSALGLYGSGLESLQNWPKISVDFDALANAGNAEEDLVFEIRCERVQERPPFESFNHIRRPFLPLLSFRDRQTSADILSRHNKVWDKSFDTMAAKLPGTTLHDLKLDLTSHSLSVDIADNCDGSSIASTTSFSQTSRKSSGSGYLKQKFFSDIENRLENHPLGPSKRFTSSCVLSTGDKLSYCDHTEFLTSVPINRSVAEDSVFLTEVDFSPKNCKIFGDNSLSRRKQCFGAKSMSTMGGDEIFALKYWHGISIVNSKNEKLAQKVSSTPFADMDFLPFVDSLAAVDIAGTLGFYDFKANSVVHKWKSVFTERMDGFDWALLSMSPSNAFYARVATRTSIELVDLRCGADLSILFEAPEFELFAGFCRSDHSEYQVYCTTNMSTRLLDERFTKKALTKWHHDIKEDNRIIPYGIESHYESGMEYVATYWQNGDVNLLCNDWNHSICPQRVNSDTRMVLSCQKKSTKSDIIFPLSRGRPASMPSVDFLLNSTPFDRESTFSRLQVPWTGLTILPASADTNSVLTFVAVNAVGDIFMSEMSCREPKENWVDKIVEDFLDNVDSDDEELAAMKNLEGENVDPVFTQTDQYPLKWLLPRPIEEIELEHLNEWEAHTGSDLVKFSFASTVFKRSGLPTKDMANKRSIRRVATQVGSTQKTGAPKKIERPKVDDIFAWCPYFNKVDIGAYEDPEGQRIAKIFAGESIFNETELTDTESDAKFLSENLKQKKLKRLPPGLPEDTSYTMDQFLLGLDNNATSTQVPSQEAAFVDNRANETTVGEDFSTAMNNTTLCSVGGTSQSRKKKRKKHMTGF